MKLLLGNLQKHLRPSVFSLERCKVSTASNWHGAVHALIQTLGGDVCTGACLGGRIFQLGEVGSLLWHLGIKRNLAQRSRGRAHSRRCRGAYNFFFLWRRWLICSASRITLLLDLFCLCGWSNLIDVLWVFVEASRQCVRTLDGVLVVLVFSVGTFDTRAQAFGVLADVRACVQGVGIQAAHHVCVVVTERLGAFKVDVLVF